MKKRSNIKSYVGSIVLLFLVFNVQSINAQINVLLGFEGVTTMGEFKNIASVGGGASGGIEFGLAKKIGITAQLGFIYLMPVKDFESVYMFPFQGGFKYYISSKENGGYSHLQIGIHQINTTKEMVSSFGYYERAESNSYSEMSYGLGVGYIVDGNVDISLRYNFVTINGDRSAYLGIRLAISFI